MNEEATKAVKDLIHATDKIKEENQLLRERINRLPESAHTLAKERLRALAEELRVNYDMSIPLIRRFLREMLAVTV